MPKKKRSFVQEHEQALLVALAYLIGFTTAYIGFALNDSGDKRYKIATPTSDTHEVLGINQAAASNTIRAVTTDEGLFVMKDETERILSSQIEATEYQPGQHQTIVTTTISPAGDYVHYCAEVASSEAGTCSHFVYSVADDTVYRVLSNDVPLGTSASVAKETAWRGNNLSIGIYVSSNASTPWLVE